MPTDVPTLSLSNGRLFAEWDAETERICVDDEMNRYMVAISPDEVRRLYAWVEEHGLT